MKFTTLTLVNNQAQWSGCKKRLREVFGPDTPLLYMEGAESIASGYNSLSRVIPETEVFVFLHQDTILLFENREPLEVYLKELKTPGVLGFCGSASQEPDKFWYQSNNLYGSLVWENNPLIFQECKSVLMRSRLKYQPIETLDGYCLIIPKTVFNFIGGFDNTYPAFHGYDMDICLSALKAGFINYVLDLPTQHLGSSHDETAKNKALEHMNLKWKNFLSVRRMA